MNSGFDVDELLKNIHIEKNGRVAIGRIIKEFREKEGFSRIQLRQATNLSESDIESFEEGKEFNFDVFKEVMSWVQGRTGQEFNADIEVLILLSHLIKHGTLEQSKEFLKFIESLK